MPPENKLPFEKNYDGIDNRSIEDREREYHEQSLRYGSNPEFTRQGDPDSEEKILDSSGQMVLYRNEKEMSRAMDRQYRDFHRNIKNSGDIKLDISIQEKYLTWLLTIHHYLNDPKKFQLGFVYPKNPANGMIQELVIALAGSHKVINRFADPAILAVVNLMFSMDLDPFDAEEVKTFFQSMVDLK